MYNFLRNYKYDEIIYSSNLDNFLIIFYSLKVQFKTCQQSAQLYRFPILKPEHAGVPNCLKHDTSYKCTNVAPVYSYRSLQEKQNI